MKQEIKEVIGDIQNIRKDFKALQVENLWYSSFILLDDFEKGDCVKIQYSENTKNGKTFLNIKHIEMVEAKDLPLVQKLTEIQHEVSDTTLNTILMCAKEIHIYNNKPLIGITKELIESYKLIKSV
jgi:hypothetical protein